MSLRSSTSWWRALGALWPLAALAVVVPPLSGLLLMAFLPTLGAALRADPVLGLLTYVGAFSLLGGLGLLPTYAQSLLGGWAFGPVRGLAAALAGFVGAALVSDALARRMSDHRIEDVLIRQPRWRAICRALVRSHVLRAALIVALVRLPPNAPFAATNVALAAIRVPRLALALGTALGLAPRTAAVVYVGAGLSTLDMTNRPQTGSFLLGAAVTVGVMIALGLLARRQLQRIEDREEPADLVP